MCETHLSCVPVRHTAGSHCPAQLNSSSSQPCLLCPGGTGELWFSVLEVCLRKIWILMYYSCILFMALSLFFHWQNVTIMKSGTGQISRTISSPQKWYLLINLIGLIILTISTCCKKGDEILSKLFYYSCFLFIWPLPLFLMHWKLRNLKIYGRNFLIKNEKVQLKSNTLNKLYTITYTASFLL